MRNVPAIVILGPASLATARRIQGLYPQAPVYGLQGRVAADIAYDDFGATLRELYQSGTPIVALCAAGIVIRSLAPVLADKEQEPPVLAVAEDGSAVVPLLGGLGGVNHIAREIAALFGIGAAITTAGELRFGTCLLNPPDGYVLADVDQGKRFVADLLAGQGVQVDGAAPWLAQARLPLRADAERRIRVTCAAAGGDEELLIHPRALLVALDGDSADLAARVRFVLAAQGLAPAALACLLAPRGAMTDRALADAAQTLGVPLRFAARQADEGAADWLLRQLPLEQVLEADGLLIGRAAQPIEVARLGQARGRLSVVGLGPGAAELMVPAVRRALDQAEDILGYETYVNMAGPLRPEQVRHCSDNREELQRARHAFELAAEGRRAVVVSSGDPGVFAMAAAVLEALEQSDDPAWHAVELEILPGVSAALATAALAGAPLGHDFCLLSLSDNLKPWAVIEQRLEHAGAADLVMAFYNPISRARPWQLGRALEIVAGHRRPETRVLLGRDIGRPGERLTSLTLGELRPEMVDMRTLVIVGSSTTRSFPRAGGGEWVYTPRWYP
ncbi:cobalt-precorrin 5A hydrolase / precorrin-3B C17-methyltransferase [Geopseudomonas sagittaria]|uniref:Cobalt-precorrin 5A hydrolase / precorrin-3B C17-methyltransferase n=1 Tax=Geopseudomonas sagittaria TaxID=1135990 RepID=A0A1I5X6Q5_9GAMM|nr:precorrin-3B C(17)-methyltransferase [Pseudomonas sagittaria]SFQ27624.1 cobalt-precorrin 5A hydrolase / precorrin-3B C17-methyltransferase [Pseudomonas sagittaria]